MRTGEGAEQADAADEGWLEPSGGIMVGKTIANQGKVVRPSQLLFRFFDIVKPPPIRLLERLKGGYGVVLDDVLAGAYANVVLQIVHLFIKSTLSIV